MKHSRCATENTADVQKLNMRVLEMECLSHWSGLPKHVWDWCGTRAEISATRLMVRSVVPLFSVSKLSFEDDCSSKVWVEILRLVTRIFQKLKRLINMTWCLLCTDFSEQWWPHVDVRCDLIWVSISWNGKRTSAISNGEPLRLMFARRRQALHWGAVIEEVSHLSKCQVPWPYK